MAGLNTQNCLLDEVEGVVREFSEIPLPFSRASSGHLDVLFTGTETLVLWKGVVYQIGGAVSPTLEDVFLLSDLGLTRMIHHHVKGLKRVLFAYSSDALIRYDIETRSLYKVDFAGFRAHTVSLCQQGNSLGFWVST